jgi:hypothetical protein
MYYIFFYFFAVWSILAAPKQEMQDNKNCPTYEYIQICGVLVDAKSRIAIPITSGHIRELFDESRRNLSIDIVGPQLSINGLKKDCRHIVIEEKPVIDKVVLSLKKCVAFSICRGFVLNFLLVSTQFVKKQVKF